MEAAVAAVAADFVRPDGASTSAQSGGSARGGRSRQGQRHRPSQQDGDGGSSSRGGHRTGGARQRAQRNGHGPNGMPTQQAVSSALDLPAPATQVTRPQTQRQPRQSMRYRSQLSEAAPSANSTRNGDASASTSLGQAIPSEEELEKLSYRERLTLQLNTSSIDCPICVDSIKRKQPIASCRTCSAPYHLKCLKDWAERSIATVKEKAALQPSGVQVRANWRCPSCQSQYGESEIPRNYWCFCGKMKEPRIGGMTSAHSCGGPCRRQRPEGCNHACPLTCHPAKCDPCNVMLRMRCHCGKEEKAIKCGTLHAENPGNSGIDVNKFLSCGNTCRKVLSCGLHSCEEECHEGDCGMCGLVREKICYCGGKVIEAACGGAKEAEHRQECFAPDGENVPSWTGEFSCGQPSTWKYECGIHDESALERLTCHPHHSEQPSICPRSPSLVSTCSCGQTSLSALSVTRTSCQDRIPSCGKICNKIRASCGHACSQTCHESECGRCLEEVTVVCRCGNEKRTMRCCERQEQGEEELTCERVCKALRACGRHECGRRCCPLAFQEANRKQRRRLLASVEEEDPMGLHVCDRVCGKKLNCGNHNCEQPDHRGPCPPCLRSSFDEVSCHCGSTVLIPPVPCSTRIVCNQPCVRSDPPCGHPKAPHACHEDDVACPPCPFLTTKTCQCDRRNQVPNVRCSQANVSCGKPCGSLLSCGYHRCRKLCHPSGECEECVQTCDKPRRHCGHPCQLRCHAPSKCPVDEPCPQLVEAQCPCGRIKQRTRCGSCDSRPESNGSVQLSCTPQCAVAQRNAALADALGVSKERAAGGSQVATWLPETLQYYGEHNVWAKGIEQSFLDFFSSGRATHLFPAMKHPHRKFVHEMAEKFKVRSESLDEEPFRSVLVSKKSDSAIPKPSISEAWLSQFKPAPSALPKKTLVTQAPVSAATSTPSNALVKPVNALFLEACFGYDEQSLKEALQPYMSGMQFAVKWLNDEDVICIPRTVLPTAELSSKIRTLRNTMRYKIPSCRTVEAAFFDAVSNSTTYKEKSWSSVPMSTSTSASSSTSTVPPSSSANRWENSRLHTTNGFSGLSVNDRSQAKSKTASASRPGTPSRDIEILANGLHRAPSAVIVQGHLPSDGNGNVVENWEDDM